MVRNQQFCIHGWLKHGALELDIPPHMVPPNPDDSDSTFLLFSKSSLRELTRVFDKYCLHRFILPIRMEIQRI
jgi:hypothetical protein